MAIRYFNLSFSLKLKPTIFVASVSQQTPPRRRSKRHKSFGPRFVHLAISTFLDAYFETSTSGVSVKRNVLVKSSQLCGGKKRDIKMNRSLLKGIKPSIKVRQCETSNGIRAGLKERKRDLGVQDNGTMYVVSPLFLSFFPRLCPNLANTVLRLSTVFTLRTHTTPTWLSSGRAPGDTSAQSRPPS